MLTIAGGRPNVYDTKIQPYLKQIVAMREADIPYDDIYPLLGIARRTFFNYLPDIEEFMHSLKKDDAWAIKQIKYSLYDKALGRAKKVVEIERPNEHGEMVLVERRIETLPASDVAIFFTLTNLDPENWKHRQTATDDERNDLLVKSFKEALKENATDT